MFSGHAIDDSQDREEEELLDSPERHPEARPQRPKQLGQTLRRSARSFRKSDETSGICFYQNS